MYRWANAGFAAGAGFVGGQEAVPELAVEGVVLAEPALGAGFVPEGDDFGGGGEGSLRLGPGPMVSARAYSPGAPGLLEWSAGSKESA